MPRIEKSYRPSPGRFGTRLIEQYGRCDGGAATVESIYAGVSLGEVVRLPNSKGVVWKALDGIKPPVYDITPPTIGMTLRCVKIEADVQPFAALQEGGEFAGMTVCLYRMLFQEIG